MKCKILTLLFVMLIAISAKSIANEDKEIIQLMNKYYNGCKEYADHLKKCTKYQCEAVDIYADSYTRFEIIGKESDKCILRKSTAELDDSADGVTCKFSQEHIAAELEYYGIYFNSIAQRVEKFKNMSDLKHKLPLLFDEEHMALIDEYKFSRLFDDTVFNTKVCQSSD